jgi:glycogen(starch) synthase
MTQALRIAIVSREYPPFFGGGIGTYARWIVPALIDQGARVHMITQAFDRTRPRVEINGRLIVHRIPIGTGEGGWPNAMARFSLQAARLVASLYRTGQIDLAEFAECEAAGLATLLTHTRRPPTIVQLHTPSEQLFVLRSLSSQTLDAPHRLYFEMERLAMHLADDILAPSRFIANWAKSHYEFESDPAVIPYATDELPPPPPPTDYSLGRTVFYAGRIEPRKGVESLVDAFNKVARANPDVTLRLAGGDTSGAPDGGSMQSYLQSLIEPDVRSRINFLGRLNRESMDIEYARANICVIPSLWENFPNTCIEAMSSARAVLVSDQGGMQEMFSDSRAGCTFAAGDPDSLARVLSAMLDETDESLIERGAIARSEIENLCDPSRVATERIAHAHSIIERRLSTHPGTSNGALSAWKGFEDTLNGKLETFQTPLITQGISRWVERSEEASCNVS